MYKILNGLSPDIMQDIFETKCNYYNTRNAPIFSPRNIKTDMDYRPSVRWLQKFGTLYPKRWNKLLFFMTSRPKSKSGSLKTVPADSVELTFYR